MTDKIKGIVAFGKLDEDQGKIESKINKGIQQYENSIEAKTERVRKYRQEASRLSAMANKRIERLERNKLQDTPAYQAYIQGGGGRFGVKGKSFNEVQAEVARLNRFLESNTSTISGVNTYLKDMAENTGIKYDKMKDLYKIAPKFFELTSKVEDYLRTVEDMASAIGYQKIWEAVNIYTAEQKIDLSESNVDIDSMIEQISDALTEHQKPENIRLSSGQFVTDEGLKASTWFKLPKDKE